MSECHDMIALENDRLRIRFGSDSWASAAAYDVFIRSKKIPESTISYNSRENSYLIDAPGRFAELFGVDSGCHSTNWLAPAKYLHDYQRWIVYDLALLSKRFAIWADTGLGKTAMFLEWARQVRHRTGGRGKERRRIICRSDINNKSAIPRMRRTAVNTYRTICSIYILC